MDDLKRDLASLRLDDEPPRSRRGTWVALLLVAFIGSAGSIYWWGRAVFAATEVETATPVIDRTVAGAGAPGYTGSPVLTASGYVVARRKAVVSAKIQGRLAQLRVEEGSHVTENEVIARLESADYEAQVWHARAVIQQADAQAISVRAQIRRAEADLAEARRQLAVNDRLTNEKILPSDTLEASRSRVQVLEAALGQAQAETGRAEAARQQAQADLWFAEAQLANTVIRAPFAGIVVKKMAEVGESVAPIPPGVNLSTSSGAIVALADLETLEVEVDVAEANVAKLTAAQPAEVTVEAFPDKRFRAELRQIIPTADRTKATVLVKVTILDKDPNLKPEMSAKATFLERPQPVAAGAGASADPAVLPKPTILVPSQAVVTRGGGPHVLEVIQGVVRVVPVTTGATRQDRVVISTGLVGSETLVLNPSESLQEGDRVRIRH